eukprot:6104621-Pleurochrysis_carterae.AAC.1
MSHSSLSPPIELLPHERHLTKHSYTVTLSFAAYAAPTLADMLVELKGGSELPVSINGTLGLIVGNIRPTI